MKKLKYPITKKDFKKRVKNKNRKIAFIGGGASIPILLAIALILSIPISEEFIKDHPNQITNKHFHLYLTSDADNPDLDGYFNLSWSWYWSWYSNPSYDYECNESELCQENILYYTIYHSLSYISEINESHSIITTNLTNYNYQIIDFENGVHYFIIQAIYKNKAKNSNCIFVNITKSGQSPQSFILSTTADNPDLDNSFYLNWTSSLYADNYSLYLNNSLYIEGLTNTSYYFSNLPNGEYNFSMIAFNDYGNYSSNWVVIVIPPLPQSFILSTTADDPDLDNSFYLNWTSSLYADNYSLYLNNSLYIEGLTNTSYYFSNLPNGEYNFSMIAFNNYGNYSSNIITINIIAKTDGEQQDEEKDDDKEKYKGDFKKDYWCELLILLLLLFILFGTIKLISILRRKSRENWIKFIRKFAKSNEKK